VASGRCAVSGEVTVVQDFKRTHFYSEGITLSQDGGMMLLDYADPDQAARGFISVTSFRLTHLLEWQLDMLGLESDQRARLPIVKFQRTSRRTPVPGCKIT
jgi:hypothetical protein